MFYAQQAMQKKIKFKGGAKKVYSIQNGIVNSAPRPESGEEKFLEENECVNF
jgi:hypothetical protein